MHALFCTLSSGRAVYDLIVLPFHLMYGPVGLKMHIREQKNIYFKQ